MFLLFFFFCLTLFNSFNRTLRVWSEVYRRSGALKSYAFQLCKVNMVHQQSSLSYLCCTTIAQQSPFTTVWTCSWQTRRCTSYKRSLWIHVLVWCVLIHQINNCVALGDANNTLLNENLVRRDMDVDASTRLFVVKPNFMPTPHLVKPLLLRSLASSGCLKNLKWCYRSYAWMMGSHHHHRRLSTVAGSGAGVTKIPRRWLHRQRVLFIYFD